MLEAAFQTKMVILILAVTMPTFLELRLESVTVILTIAIPQ